MEKMNDLHHELGDIKVSLKELHKNPNNTDIGTSLSLVSINANGLILNLVAHKIEHLVKLESEYGPLPQYSPAIDDVLGYLKKVCTSSSLPITPVYFCCVCVHVASWIECPQRHKNEVTSLFHHQS